MRPAKARTKSGKIALFVRISPETHGNLTQRSCKEQKTFVDLIEEAFGPKNEAEEDALAELNF